jgi:hypothetical protein
VPIDDLPAWSRQELTDGTHDLDRFLGQHLRSDDRIVFGNDLTKYIKFDNDNLTATEIFRSFLSHKKRRLGRTYRSVDPLDVEEGGLQRMLELPCSIGRRALQAFDEVAPSGGPALRSVDQQLVTVRAHDLLARFGLNECFDTLAKDNADFSLLLDGAIDGKVSRREYEDVIRDLHAIRLPQAVRWINQIQQRLLPVLEEYSYGVLAKKKIIQKVRKPLNLCETRRLRGRECMGSGIPTRRVQEEISEGTDPSPQTYARGRTSEGSKFACAQCRPVGPFTNL